MYLATVNNDIFFRTDSDSDDFTVTEFAVNLVAGQTGEANFTLPPCNLKQNLPWNKYTTVIRVYKDNKKIFAGRVYLDPEITFDNQKSISCEGIKGILNDAVIVPYEYSGNLHGLFEKFVTEFNEQTGYNITVRNITVDDVDDIEIEETGWQTAIEHLDSLANEYGGYIDVIESDDGTLYIDWLKEYTEVNSQKIELGENLIDLVGSDATEVVYTHLIPLGATVTDDSGVSTGSRLTIESVNEGIYYLTAENEYIQKYGHVYGTQIFEDITDASTLMSKGQEALTDMLTSKASYEITAVDLKDYGIDVESFEIRKLAIVSSAINGITNMSVPVLQQSLDLLNPSNNKMILSNGIKSYTTTENGRIASTAKDIIQENDSARSAATKMQIETEINNRLSNTHEISVLSGTRTGNVFNVYMSLQNLNNESKTVLGTTELIPANTQAIIPVYSQSESSQYTQIGTVWISKANGSVTLFKPADVTSVYIHGSYIIERSSET